MSLHRAWDRIGISQQDPDAVVILNAPLTSVTQKQGRYRGNTPSVLSSHVG